MEIYREEKIKKGYWKEDMYTETIEEMWENSEDETGENVEEAWS